MFGSGENGDNGKWERKKREKYRSRLVLLFKQQF